jgi:glycosyltransferase
VVDGQSTDRTLDIVREFGIRSGVIDSQRDDGIYDALNRGINLASGDIVGFLHSDDFFPSPEVLADIASAFEDHSIDLSFGDLAYVGKSDPNRVVRRWKSGAYHPTKLKYGWMPPHPTVYARRELLQKYMFDLSFRVSGDYDAMLRLLSRESINAAYIPYELVHMRLGGTSNKNVANVLQKVKEDWHAIRSNDVGGFMTLVCKNIRKLPQFFVSE